MIDKRSLIICHGALIVLCLILTIIQFVWGSLWGGWIDILVLTCIILSSGLNLVKLTTKDEDENNQTKEINDGE